MFFKYQEFRGKKKYALEQKRTRRRGPTPVPNPLLVEGRRLTAAPAWSRIGTRYPSLKPQTVNGLPTLLTLLYFTYFYFYFYYLLYLLYFTLPDFTLLTLLKSIKKDVIMLTQQEFQLLTSLFYRLSMENNLKITDLSVLPSHCAMLSQQKSELPTSMFYRLPVTQPISITTAQSLVRERPPGSLTRFR